MPTLCAADRCDQAFDLPVSSPHKTYCSLPCRNAAKHARRYVMRGRPTDYGTAQCFGCGADVLRLSSNRKRCDPCSARRIRERSAVKVGRTHERRLQPGATAETFKPSEVFERDGWICQICGSQIDPALRYPDPLSVSLDHIVGLAAGGDHTVANCQAAHLRCNYTKPGGHGRW